MVLQSKLTRRDDRRSLSPALLDVLTEQLTYVLLMLTPTALIGQMGLVAQNKFIEPLLYLHLEFRQNSWSFTQKVF